MQADVTRSAEEHIYARIRAFIDEEILSSQGVTITDEAPLLNGTIDSLSLMQLVAFLESEFDVEIDDGDITRDNFNTVEAIGNLIGAGRP